MKNHSHPSDTGPDPSPKRIPLEGTFNFRDLGGYRASNGRRVKKCMIYRSDNLSSLTSAAQQELIHMKIRLVCDFRSKDEAEAKPDRLPENAGISYLHLPVVHGSIDSIAAFKKIKKGDTSWFSDRFMLDGYLKSIDRFPDIWGKLINTLAEPASRPAVFHCSAGKDRAGIAATLILISLGVPEDTIISDHQLSNRFIADGLDEIYDLIRSYGVDPLKIAPYFAAPLDCIEKVLSHLRDTYGSGIRYLTDRAGVSTATLDRFRSDLLE